MTLSAEKIQELQTEKVAVILGPLDIPEGGRWFHAPMEQLSNSVTYYVMPSNAADILEDPSIGSSGTPHPGAIRAVQKKSILDAA